MPYGLITLKTFQSKRPMALKYTSFYNELPDNWRKFLHNQDSDGKRKGLVSLYTMLQKNDMNTAENALAFAISNGVHDADSILAAYRTITSNSKSMKPEQLKCNIMQMPSFVLIMQSMIHSSIRR